MRVLHLSCFDWMGGAGKAVYRLHTALKHQGVDSHILVDVKERKDDQTVHSLTGLTGLPSRALYHLRGKVDQYPLKKYRVNGLPWAVGRLKRNILRHINKYNPDVVHVHWTSATASIDELTHLPMPVVWTMHDMNLATGGCCCPGTCSRYRNGCGACPQLGSKKFDDFSAQVYSERKRSFSGCKAIFVALSNWQRNIVACSPIMDDCEIVRIPNGVDVELFCPCDRKKARLELNLPMESKLIVFGAESILDPVKGATVLVDAVRSIVNDCGKNEVIKLVTFGRIPDDNKWASGIDVINLGYLNQISLAKLFSACDVAVVPSLQDNCPQVPLEAQACGCPVVGFAGTGVAELIDDAVSGKVVDFNDTESLCNGILHVLKTEGSMRADCRKYIVDNFDISVVAEKYINLYYMVRS